MATEYTFVGKAPGGVAVLAEILGMLVAAARRLFKKRLSGIEENATISQASHSLRSARAPEAARPSARDPLGGKPWREEGPGGLVSTSYGLQVTIERFENGPGVSRKIYVLDPPVAGFDRVESFDGVNLIGTGRGRINEDGRYLLISDAMNVWLFDVRKGRVKHWVETDDRFYIDEPRCRGSEIELTFSDRADRSPSCLHLRIDDEGEFRPPLKWDVELAEISPSPADSTEGPNRDIGG